MIEYFGGQKQRLGKSRALDIDTENKYNLDKNLTILIVAQRISTLKDYNEIIIIDNRVASKIKTYSEKV